MENNNYVPEIYIGENGNWFINGVDTGTHAQGEPGKDGITPHISEDGFWCIGDVKTTVRAKGYDGYTPFINEEGYWCTGEICSGVKALGEKGDKGEKGESGVPGDIGPAGPQGIQGPPGMPGTNGKDGIDGTTGPKGDKGDKGEPGAAGPQGLQGPKGVKGDTGAQGSQGMKGDKGDTGAVGPQGIQGIQGIKGDVGPVNLANNLITTDAGYALDARQGSVIKEIQNMVGMLSSDYRIFNLGSLGLDYNSNLIEICKKMPVYSIFMDWCGEGAGRTALNTAIQNPGFWGSLIIYRIGNMWDIKYKAYDKNIYYYTTYSTTNNVGFSNWWCNHHVTSYSGTGILDTMVVRNDSMKNILAHSYTKKQMIQQTNCKICTLEKEDRPIGSLYSPTMIGGSDNIVDVFYNWEDYSVYINPLHTLPANTPINFSIVYE